MCDGFLVLAKIQDDSNWDSKKSISVPSCFFVPRWLPSGERNPFHIQRLKDKLGNRSNASSEIEFNNTYGVFSNSFVCFDIEIFIIIFMSISVVARTRT